MAGTGPLPDSLLLTVTRPRAAGLRSITKLMLASPSSSDGLLKSIGAKLEL